jgi:hypothetical protein
MRLTNHLLLCSRGVSTRHTPLPIMSVHTYLHGGAMRTKRHYTQLAQAIAQSLCGYREAGPLWRAVQHTHHKDWKNVVLLVNDVGPTTTIDWGDIILVDHKDKEAWGPALTTLVIRELNLIAHKATP